MLSTLSSLQSMLSILGSLQSMLSILGNLQCIVSMLASLQSMLSTLHCLKSTASIQDISRSILQSNTVCIRFMNSMQCAMSATHPKQHTFDLINPTPSANVAIHSVMLRNVQSVLSIHLSPGILQSMLSILGNLQSIMAMLENVESMRSILDYLQSVYQTETICSRFYQC